MTEFICGDCGNMGEEPSLFEVPNGQYVGESKLAVKFAKKTQMGYMGCPECQSPNVYFDIPEEDEKFEDVVDEDEDELEEEYEDEDDGQDEIDLGEVDEDVSLDVEDTDVDEEEIVEVPKKRKKKRKKKVVSADEPKKAIKVKKKKKKRKHSGDVQPQLAPEGKKVMSSLAGLSEGGDVVKVSHTVPQEVNPSVAAASNVANELGNVNRHPKRPKRLYRRECRECFNDFKTKHQDVLLCKRCLRRFRSGR